MTPDEELVPGEWYWLRHANGNLAPYRFHQTRVIGNQWMGEFFVGSMVTTWSLGAVVGKAEMPKENEQVTKPPTCSYDNS